MQAVIANACMTNGALTTSVGGRDRQTTVTSYRCALGLFGITLLVCLTHALS